MADLLGHPMATGAESVVRTPAPVGRRMAGLDWRRPSAWPDWPNSPGSAARRQPRVPACLGLLRFVQPRIQAQLERIEGKIGAAQMAQGFAPAQKQRREPSA